MPVNDTATLERVFIDRLKADLRRLDEERRWPVCELAIDELATEVPEGEPCPDEELADVAVRRHSGATVVEHDPSLGRAMARRSS